MKIVSTSYTACFVLLLIIAIHHVLAATGRKLPTVSKPDPNNAARSARWLVSQNSWGVLNTISIDLKGAPFGNVVSFSDGKPGAGSGTPYFYLTTLDPTARNALNDSRASFTLSEYTIGTCGKKDPENPTCSKITLSGQLIMIDEKDEVQKVAKTALFSKHPEMKGWPKGHNFRFYKLIVENIFLINWFGGPKPITLDEYYHTPPSMASNAYLM